MNVAERSIRIPADSVMLDADLAVPEPAAGGAVRARQRQQPHSPRNRFVAREVQCSGLATVLADLLVSRSLQARRTCLKNPGRWSRSPAGPGLVHPAPEAGGPVSATPEGPVPQHARGDHAGAHTCPALAPPTAGAVLYSAYHSRYYQDERCARARSLMNWAGTWQVRGTGRRPREINVDTWTASRVQPANRQGSAGPRRDGPEQQDSTAPAGTAAKPTGQERSAHECKAAAAAAGKIDVGGDLTVNRLGFGAMRITGPGIWGDPPDQDRAKEALRRAVALDVTFIDTADSYGPEVSEKLIAEALYPYPEELVIATKGGLTRPGPGQWVPDGRPEHLRRASRAA